MSTVLAATGEGFHPPGAQDFWQPLIGHGAFALTRPMVLIVLSTALLAAVLLLATRRLRVVPGKGQAVLEAGYSFVRNGIGREMIGEGQMRPYLPLLFSLFSLILVNNLFGIIPFIQYPTAARIGFPIALMLFVYLTYIGLAIRRKGFGDYIVGLAPKGIPWPVLVLLYPLELITEFFTRPVTLALRLFGNMFAGHLILLLMAVGVEYLLLDTDGFVLPVMSVAPFVMFFVMTVFEILIEVLQAYIFTMLAAFYIAGSLADEH